MKLTPKDEIKTSSSFEWDEEPTIIEWKFKKLNDKHLQVTIIQYDDGIKEEDGKNLGKVVLEETCKTQDMLSQLVSSLDTIILKHGFVGYRENWYAGEFLISRYLKLKHQLHYQSSIQIENVGENEYIKSTIEEELKMLNGLL
ncbi:hypothetical protein M3231_03570 [Neobacillus mesonae]|nr:hypothetical protein [Neobacillus mesonae]